MKMKTAFDDKISLQFHCITAVVGKGCFPHAMHRHFGTASLANDNRRTAELLLFIFGVTRSCNFAWRCGMDSGNRTLENGQGMPWHATHGSAGAIQDASVLFGFVHSGKLCLLNAT